jgi:hypothetical protein
VAKSRLRSQSVRLWIVLPIVAAFLALLPLPAWAVDDLYSRTFYPFVQRIVTAISNLVPVAVLDVLIVLSVIGVVVRSIILGRTALGGDVAGALFEGLKRLLRATAAVVVVFFLAWGFNYRRTPLAEVVTDQPAASTANLQAAIADANDLAAGLRPVLAGMPEPAYEEIARELPGPMNRALASLNRTPLATPGRPKYSLILTPFFTWAGVSGMLNPLALESIVDPGLLPPERPFVLAHEWAHLSGHADEAEASAVGWLACMKGSPTFAYSASLYLITEAAGELPPAARKASLSKLSDGVRKDLELIANRAREVQKPRVQHAAFKVYDEYLRANQVDDGVKSYGRALTLILSKPLRGALDGYRTK